MRRGKEGSPLCERCEGSLPRLRRSYCSRCPTSAECVTPGTVTIRVETASGVLPTGETTLVLEAEQDGPTIKKFASQSAISIWVAPLYS